MKAIILNLFKRCFKVFVCIISLTLGIFFGGLYSEASSPQASGFYRTDHTTGIATSGPLIFQLFLGYSTSYNANSSINNWKSVTQNSDVVFINSHGGNGYFSLASGVMVTGNSVQTMTFSDTPKLIYIAACNAGNASPSYGEVGLQLKNKGVTAVVAFKDTITASTGTDGIHKFNSKVATKLAFNHLTLAQALTQSVNEIYAEDGHYWGADSRKVYGNGSISF